MNNEPTVAVENDYDNVFYGDNFYSDFYELIEKIEEEEGCSIAELPEDYKITFTKGVLTPVVTFDADSILQSAGDDGYSEQNGEYEIEDCLKAINECIDFEKLNAMIPKNYRDSDDKVTLTKADLIRLAAD